MKAHIFRELVNDLRDIATQRHGSEQLRERISERLRQDVSIDEDPANDGWIPWPGGECPVASDAVVDVLVSDGNRTLRMSCKYAYTLRWSYFPKAENILAYRIVRK